MISFFSGKDNNLFRLKVISVKIRLVEKKDFSIWIELRYELWQYHTIKELENEAQKIFKNLDATPVFVSESNDGEITGFAEFSIHETALGCETKNIGFIEAWYVKPEYRRSSIGRMLIENGEHWAISKGCSEMASDTNPTYPISAAAHKALGYEEVGRKFVEKIYGEEIYYRKKLCIQNGKSLDIFSIINIDYETYIRRTTEGDSKLIQQLMDEYWGGEPLVVNCKNYYPSKLTGILLFKSNEVLGFLFYDIQGTEYEIIVFEIFEKFSGFGTIVLNDFIKIAKSQNCTRIHLMTTNDDLDALRFYQRRGFIIRGIRLNALEESRKMKPSIPYTGDYGIPLRDEIELEYSLENI